MRRETAQDLQVEVTTQPGAQASNPTVKLDTQAFYRLDVIITEGQGDILKSVSLGRRIELSACVHLTNQRGDFEVNLGRSPLLHIGP